MDSLGVLSFVGTNKDYATQTHPVFSSMDFHVIAAAIIRIVVFVHSWWSG